MDYEVTEILEKYIPVKKSTEYAIFITYDNLNLRLDMEFKDTWSKDKIISFMKAQAEQDMADKEWIDDIRKRLIDYYKHSSDSDSEWSKEGFLKRGYIHSDVTF